MSSADLGQKEAQDEALRKSSASTWKVDIGSGLPPLEALLGQAKAKDEALREEQLKHMEAADPRKWLRPQKPKKHV